MPKWCWEFSKRYKTEIIIKNIAQKYFVSFKISNYPFKKYTNSSNDDIILIRLNIHKSSEKILINLLLLKWNH